MDPQSSRNPWRLLRSVQSDDPKMTATGNTENTTANTTANTTSGPRLPPAPDSVSSGGPAAPESLAPHHLRLFALILDYLVLVLVFKLLDQLILGEHWDLRGGFTSAWTSSNSWYALIGLAVVSKDIIKGRSMGKWVTGIAVANAAEPARAPHWTQLMGRNFFLLLFPVEIVLVFTDRYCRRLGDRLLGTVVVVPARIPPPGRRLLALASFFLLGILVAFLVTGWNLRRSAAYQTARAEAEARPELMEAVGGSMQIGFSPELALSMEPGKEGATVLLTAEGNRAEAKVEVKMVLEADPRRWVVESFRILDPEESGGK